MRRSSLESRREEASPRLRNVDWPRYPVGIHGKHKSGGSRRFGHIVGLVDLEVWIPPVERGRQQVIERFRPTSARGGVESTMGDGVVFNRFRPERSRSKDCRDLAVYALAACAYPQK